MKKFNKDMNRLREAGYVLVPPPRPRRKKMVSVHVTHDGSKSPLQIAVEKSGYVWDVEMGMAQHRAVACRLLGRVLDTDEHVHHCDHCKSNNDPSNLFVLSPAIHDFIHIATMLSPITRDWPCGHQLMDPNKLSIFLAEEGIPYIWLFDEVR